MNKLEFDCYLKELNITKVELAELLNLPYNTVRGWNGNSKPYPSWLSAFFINYKKALKFDRAKKLFADEF